MSCFFFWREKIYSLWNIYKSVLYQQIRIKSVVSYIAKQCIRNEIIQEWLKVEDEDTEFV